MAHGGTTGKRRDIALHARHVFDVFTLRGSAHYKLGVLVHRPRNMYVILGSCAKSLQLSRNNRRTVLVDFDPHGSCAVRISNDRNQQ